MFRIAKPFFLKVETPLHAGSGSELGVVDLPIQREKHTEFPKIESSSLKGSIREVFEEVIKGDGDVEKRQQFIDLQKSFPDMKSKGDMDNAIKLAFGPESDKGSEYSGALGLTDARILLFPVRSMKGIFAWITCPAVLKRFLADLRLCKVLPTITNGDNKVPKDSPLKVKDNNVVLEEYTFSVSDDENCGKMACWFSENILSNDTDSYWKEKMKTDIVVLPNNDFRDFVLLSTEVIARTRIDNDKGTVVEGALFYEEYLPSETILYSLALASPLFVKDENKGILAKDANESEEQKVMKFFAEGLPSIMQIGGNATIGKGIVSTRVYGGQ